MFAAISCKAQKVNFHALNKSSRVLVNIYTTSTLVQICGGSGANTNIYIGGALFGLPQVGSIVYTSPFGGILFVGDGNWYYSNTYATSYRINALGIITEVFSC